MSFGERLRAKREALGLKQSELGAMLSITGSAVGNYENNVSMPRADVLTRIFRTLKCDANYLFQDELAVTDFFTSAEAEKIKQYRALDEHGRRLVDLALDEETRRMQEESESRETARIIPLYLTPAAAGSISPAYGDDYVDYSVPLTSPADFAVKISGDSMEPYIEDGSVVLVKRQTDLAPGDVGLFFVDGSMKCKQFCEDGLGNIYLLSLNRDRADADVTIWASSGMTVLCYGKVILAKKPPLVR
ncbi:MAG: helix-turn-helix domain-containing protein [Oscillospiraceae bacterium]|nr:helix-turn-helix domain-containing protein [Oscillospiraceae bacterium]